MGFIRTSQQPSQPAFDGEVRWELRLTNNIQPCNLFWVVLLPLQALIGGDVVGEALIHGEISSANRLGWWGHWQTTTVRAVISLPNESNQLGAVSCFASEGCLGDDDEAAAYAHRRGTASGRRASTDVCGSISKPHDSMSMHAVNQQIFRPSPADPADESHREFSAELGMSSSRLRRPLQVTASPIRIGSTGDLTSLELRSGDEQSRA
ncbi:hypothetical protein B0H66DRAFT_125203 [Apodospora peruviana]|uniref:Uncharacterized protein n=1 Tax=Apodospora peruviana TaxID=516989 RepID=A0AAE0MAZ0_9PEZI|nr:hypothetical protein B0H66DRAFT_125203 [Apodospora peruviana]